MFEDLVDKVMGADFEQEPFRHLSINDFLSQEDFDAITSAAEVTLDPADTDKELLDQCFAQGYKVVPFPGATTDVQGYLDWRAGRLRLHHHATTSGEGLVLRVASPKSPALQALYELLTSDAWCDALTARFELDRSQLTVDVGVQKYLDGYEISPHPDARKKALTYMLNLNPHPSSEHEDHHTHYLRFKRNETTCRPSGRGILDTSAASFLGTGARRTISRRGTTRS
ncbi:hypothetical protein [Actinospongicola halichondriae]|uniref:hypothetical protein n=1 Tax=Actinospongicola halichondriae TaxID=3236844 RepID=UPI003D487813